MKTICLPEKFNDAITSKLRNPSVTAYRGIKVIDCKCVNMPDDVNLLCVTLENSIKSILYDCESNRYIKTDTNKLYIGKFTLEAFNISMDELVCLIRNKKTIRFNIIQEFVGSGELYTYIITNRTYILDYPRYVNIITKIEEEL